MGLMGIIDDPVASRVRRHRLSRMYDHEFISAPVSTPAERRAGEKRIARRFGIESRASWALRPSEDEV